MFFIPYLYTILGFCFAFVGNSFTKEINELPIAQTVSELSNYLAILVGLQSSNYTETMSYHINELVFPGIIYLLAVLSMLMACRVLYYQLEVEKLEESLVKMVMISSLLFVCGFIFLSGGKILVITFAVFTLLLNLFSLIAACCSPLFQKSRPKANV